VGISDGWMDGVGGERLSQTEPGVLISAVGAACRGSIKSGIDEVR